MVAGGKTKDNWLKTADLLDLSPYLKKGLTVRDKNGMLVPLTSQWRSASPMCSPRANFAMIALKDYVYAIGGIEAKDRQIAHKPVLSQHACERYTP